MTEMLAQQLTDPFRIGLIVALVLTMLRNRAASGVIVPLIAGVVFVAVLIPLTLSGTDFDAGEIVTGLAANLVILAVVLGIWRLWRRLRG